MIKHLVDKRGVKATPLVIFRALSKSKDLEDFLKRIAIEEQPCKEFLEKHRAPAERDFRKFLAQYVASDEGSNSGESTSGD